MAALNTQERLLIAYCFRRRDSPWVTVWEENRAITAIPWKGRIQARGLEFGTTPMPVSRRENFLAGGPVFGVPTLNYVPAHDVRVLRYAAFLAHLPAGFNEISNIELGEKEFLVFDARGREPLRVPASGASGLT